ncbi:GH32 C-terminal domain-containing protein [Actinotalea subterranea]|uniref:GH32 C-terminal domain-containing protein n=1 Tax=Actinotalea subterranea TaxID=2607497 RepID=UPI0011ECEBB8|nr:GH32 C-terminal domain-containing protein [Actinotalea subterranea]
MSLLYRPPSGWVGDVIPHFHDGEFWLYFLHDQRDPAVGMPWRTVRTRDFVHFEDGGVAIPSGGPAAEDFNAYTGSLVTDDGRVHLFYTAQNPERCDPVTGQPYQLVAHAVSDDDMRTWRKLPEETFGAPDGYVLGDWRDPFVFRVSADEPWRMLLAARSAAAPERRSGLIAQLRSTDLHTWTVDTPFWAPDLYMAHECPDVFTDGDRWYLMYSEFTESFATRYRVAPGPDGPWAVPNRDTVDGRGFYAAKTVAGLGRRFAVGWIPSKAGERDDGAWDWAGDMAVHEVVAEDDGQLSFRLPQSIADAYVSSADRTWRPVLGDWEQEREGVSVSAPDGYAASHTGPLPSECLLSVDIELAPGTSAAGIVLRAGPDAETGYRIRLEPRRGRMTFDRWPRLRTGPMQWQISGDVPHAVELERPADLHPGRHHLDVLVDGTCVIAYLDGAVAMSARMYDHRDGGLGLFVQEGSSSFTNLNVLTRH